MHLPPLKAFGWNDKRNPWTGPPIQMEMSPSRCVWCAQQWSMGIRGDYEGCLPYHPVFTRREALILYAVDWRAWKLTEQTDNSALHSWASIYPEKSDKEALKNNNRFRHTDTLLCLFIKRGIFPSTKLFNWALIDLGINSKVCVLYCLSLGIKWEQYNIYHWKKNKTKLLLCKPKMPCDFLKSCMHFWQSRKSTEAVPWFFSAHSFSGLPQCFRSAFSDVNAIIDA